jgi:hypothetical protein
MGSHSFQTVRYTTDSAQVTYRAVCEDAAYERGHDGYSGTIATTHGVRVVGATPMTRAEAQVIIDQRIDQLSKWDVCEAISLVAETPTEYEPMGTRQVTITVPGAVYNDETLLRKALAKELSTIEVKIKPENIDRHRLASSEGIPRRFLLDATPKVTAVAPKEKTETRFFIITASDQRMPRWEDGHATQAEARAALPTLLRRDWGSIPTVECEIISMTRRVTGEPLVKATVEAKTVTATFDVDLHKVSKKATRGTTHAGWVFYGWAAS